MHPAIIHIKHKTTNELLSSTEYTVDKIIAKYSTTKTPIYKLIVKGIPVSRNNAYTVRYRCQTCLTEQEITLNLYVRKLNKDIARCVACVNKNNEKNAHHSKFMFANSKTIIAGKYIGKTISVKSRTLDDHLVASLLDWNNEHDEFKDQYQLKHLMIDDFDRVKSKMISINHGKYDNIDEWEYFPYYRIYNQTRYTPMLVQRNINLIEKPHYITFKCDNCDAEYIHRDLEVVKNQYKLLCQSCSLTNKVFRLRRFICKDESIVMWQSIPERRFIEWCEENNIIIHNGPSIEYKFRNNTHKYRVDFELPLQKMLIEIKDNHCWHKDQVASGKFGAKEECAKKWCIEHEYSYHVVFPKTLQACKTSILTKSYKI